MILRCLVIDDEQPAIDLLSRFIERTPGLTLAGTFLRPLEMLGQVRTLQPDLAFLDIGLPDISGIDLVPLLPKSMNVVLTTSFREFGPEAYNLEVTDYLLKPILYPRFLTAIERVRQHREPATGHFFVRSGNGQLARVEFCELVYISALSNYAELHFADHKIITYQSLNELAAFLPQRDFSRIHRSYIIGHRYLQLVDRDEVVLNGGKRLTIGLSYRAAFLERLRTDLLG